VQRASMGCTNQQPVRTQGQNAGRGRVRQGISGGSGLDWRNLHRAGGCGRWVVVKHGHWMGRDGDFGGDQESRGAPRDSTSIPHRSRIPFLVSEVGRGRNESGTMHRAALICTSSRVTSTFPRSGPIHASGFTAAHCAVPIPIAFIGPVPAAHSIASIHPLREALVQREKTAYSLSPARGRSIRLSLGGGEQEGGRTSEVNRFLGKSHVVGQIIRRLPNDVPEFIPPSRPSPSEEGEQRSGRLPVTSAVQYPDCSPPAHHPFWVRASSRDLSPERPIGSSFAETPALSSLWPIALATPDSSPRPRCARHMGYVDTQRIAHLHRQSLRPPALKKSAARPEQDRSGRKSSLFERRTAGTERVRRFSRRCCAGSRFLPRLDLCAPLDQAKGAFQIWSMMTRSGTPHRNENETLHRK
jgi:hypothetical protein